MTGEPTEDIPNRITFGFPAPQEGSTDFIASAGQRFFVPVSLTLRPGGQLMYGLQFTLGIDEDTGPVAAKTSAVASGCVTCLRAANTAAAAVVFAPLESIRTDTRIGPKNVLRTSARIASP